MSDILLVLIMKPKLNGFLQRNAIEKATDTLLNNEHHNINILIDRRPIFLPTESLLTPWSKVAKARNRVLTDVLFWEYQYILWIDADVVDYPCDMPSRLIEVNPEGITAPLVLIEDTPGPLFYDFAASIMKGKSSILPADRSRIVGRNLQHAPPYWPEEPKERFVEMDCVGTVTMVPTEVYLNSSDAYEDHPAFTDHWPVCRMARTEGRMVGIDRETIAWHANLPKYGEDWH